MSYVIAFGQPDDLAVYYTGRTESHGDEILGYVTDAYKFNTVKEVTEHMLKRPNDLLRMIIIEIPDCTWEILEKGFNDRETDHGTYTDEARVWVKFNSVSYITNSR